MSNAYSKKKQPELVRRSILEAAEKLAVSEGAAAVTIQAVASRVGVTKGGVMHHFPSKQSLLEAVIAQSVQLLDKEIERNLEPGDAWGRFTRAYVEVLLTGKKFGVSSPFDALSLMTFSERALIQPWNDWLDARLRQHEYTDGDLQLEIVRLAADGAWLAYIGRGPDAKLEKLQARLLSMTYR